MTDYSDLMDRFRSAFFAADAGQLGQVLGDGFEWHNHYFPADDPSPTGRVLRGIDELLAEVQWRSTPRPNRRMRGPRSV